MAEPRRPRAASAEKRTHLLDVTEEIMLSDGYAAVTSRHVAARAGIGAPLVHYYFPTIDDLFLEVLRRRAYRNVAKMAAALDAPEPLKAWWEVVIDTRGTSLFTELLAAANHRPALKAEVGKMARQVRHMQTEALTSLLPQYGLDSDRFPPVLIAATIQGLSFGLIQDQAAGYDTGHREAAAAAVAVIERLEKKRARRRRVR